MIANIKDFYNKAKTDLDLLLLGLLIFALPFERIPSVEVFGTTIRASLVVGAALLIRVAYLLLTKRLKFKWNWLYIVIALFVGWVFLIVPESINLKRGLQIAVFNGFVIAVGMAVSLVYRKEYLSKLVTLLLLSATVVSVFAIYQFFGDVIGLPGYATGLSDRYNSALFGFPRVQSTSLEPLYFGSYLLLPTLILYGLFVYQDAEIITNKTKFALIILFTTNLFLTVGRGAVFSLLVGTFALIVIAVLKKVANIKTLLKLFALIFIGFVASYLMINYLSKIPLDISKTFGKQGGAVFTQQLTTTGFGGEGDERAKSRAKAIMILNDNKSAYILGIGPGQYGPYVANNQPEFYGWPIVNNLTLELLVETGIVGLGLIVLFFLGIFYKGFRVLGSKKPDILTSSVTLALMAYFASQALQFQTFSTLYIMHIWVGAGLLLGLIITSSVKNRSN